MMPESLLCEAILSNIREKHVGRRGIACGNEVVIDAEMY